MSKSIENRLSNSMYSTSVDNSCVSETNICTIKEYCLGRSQQPKHERKHQQRHSPTDVQTPDLALQTTPQRLSHTSAYVRLL